jgi:hypothetical protein
MQCEGYRRTGGAFTIGPVKWEQCPNDAVVKLTVLQDPNDEDSETAVFPACLKCWKEALENEIPITAYELEIGGDDADRQEEEDQTLPEPDTEA